MVTSSPPSRSITVVNPASGTLRAVVGSLLEMAIHSIESLRERLGNPSLR